MQCAVEHKKVVVRVAIVTKWMVQKVRSAAGEIAGRANEIGDAKLLDEVQLGSADRPCGCERFGAPGGECDLAACAIDQQEPCRPHIDHVHFIQKGNAFGNALASENVVGVENRNIIAPNSFL